MGKKKDIDGKFDEKGARASIEATQQYLVKNNGAAVVLTIAVFPVRVEAESTLSQTMVVGGAASDEIAEFYRDELLAALQTTAHGIEAGTREQRGVLLIDKDEEGDNDERVRD